MDEIKFRDLDRKHKQLLGRERRLLRMIDKRMEKLKPLLLEVKKIRDELEPLEDELENLKKEIKNIVDVNIFTPKITIIYKEIQNKYPFYYGRIVFSEKRKDKQIPKKEENRILKELEKRNEELKMKNKPPLYTNDSEKLKEFKIRLSDWVLDWWREEGIHNKK